MMCSLALSVYCNEQFCQQADHNETCLAIFLQSDFCHQILGSEVHCVKIGNSFEQYFIGSSTGGS